VSLSRPFSRGFSGVPWIDRLTMLKCAELGHDAVSLVIPPYPLNLPSCFSASALRFAVGATGKLRLCTLIITLGCLRGDRWRNNVACLEKRVVLYL